MIYATVSRPSDRMIAYLQTVQTFNRENHSVTNLDEFHALITAHRVEAVMFGLYGLPRRAVPVGPQADRHFATMLRKVGRG